MAVIRRPISAFGLFVDLSAAIHQRLRDCNRMKSGRFDESYARQVGVFPWPPARALLLGRAYSSAGTLEASVTVSEAVLTALGADPPASPETLSPNINV